MCVCARCMDMHMCVCVCMCTYTYLHVCVQRIGSLRGLHVHVRQQSVRFLCTGIQLPTILTSVQQSYTVLRNHRLPRAHQVPSDMESSLMRKMEVYSIYFFACTHTHTCPHSHIIMHMHTHTHAEFYYGRFM